MEERFRLVVTSGDLEEHAGIYNMHQICIAKSPYNTSDKPKLPCMGVVHIKCLGGGGKAKRRIVSTTDLSRCHLGDTLQSHTSPDPLSPLYYITRL